MKVSAAGTSAQIPSNVDFSESQVTQVIDYENSKNFYSGSPKFVNDRSSIGFSAGSKCSQCALKSRQPRAMECYCFLHKRIVDVNETCSRNTKNNYHYINMRR